MRRRPFILIQPEGADTVQVKVLHGKTLCGMIFDPARGEKKKPLAVPVRDLCPACMTQHFKRREARR